MWFSMTAFRKRNTTRTSDLDEGGSDQIRTLKGGVERRKGVSKRRCYYVHRNVNDSGRA